MDIIELIQKQFTLIMLFYAFGFLVGIDVFTGLIKAWKNGRLKKQNFKWNNRNRRSSSSSIISIYQNRFI